MEIGNDPDFGNTHGEALFEYYVRIEGEAVTRSVAQKELALWIHMVALELGKTKLAGEAGTYAKRLIDEGYDTVQGLAELDIEDLVEAGMRKGDAKLIMGRVSQKCTSSGGEGSGKHGEGSANSLTDGSGDTTSTADSMSMVETYAIAASKTGAVAAVNAIKAAEPVPELKGKTTTIKVVAIIEWLKSISKHQIVKGTALGEVVLKMSKLFDWPAEEIVDKAWELAREDKTQFATQDADLLEKVKEGISGDLWSAIEEQDPKTGTAAIALLIKAVVHRPHAVMAARIAAVGNVEVVKWDTGLTKGVTQLLSLLTEVRYSPFYTYDLAFEAVVDTLQRFQHIVTKISMFWLKFQGDPETDEYRYQQSKYFDKTVTTLWSAIEVAELTGKTAQKTAPKDPERKPGKGGSGKGGKGNKGKAREKKNQPCWLYRNGQCKYGKDCIFKHEDSEGKGASVRQVLLDEMVDNSTEVTTPMTMQGQVEEGWTVVQPKQTYRKAIRRLARVLESAGGQQGQHVKSENLAWREKNDTIFRVLEDSAGGDIGCGVTRDGQEQHTKSEKFARYKKFNGSRDQLQMHRLAADGDFEAASRLRCAIEMGFSAASRTALGELTNEDTAKSVEAGAIRYSQQEQIRSAADRGHYRVQ